MTEWVQVKSSISLLTQSLIYINLPEYCIWWCHKRTCFVVGIFYDFSLTTLSYRYIKDIVIFFSLTICIFPQKSSRLTYYYILNRKVQAFNVPTFHLVFAHPESKSFILQVLHYPCLWYLHYLTYFFINVTGILFLGWDTGRNNLRNLFSWLIC